MAEPRAMGGKAGCPICSKPAQPKFGPFCSARCADVDLGRWFVEAYRVPDLSSEDSEQQDSQIDDSEG
jgi:endogenous inhibitor of DNA gyrase (YacG/DUF329 family)